MTTKRMRPAIGGTLVLAYTLACAASGAAQTATWEKVAPVPTGADLGSVAVLSPTDVWIVGHAGVVTHTTDGGATWSTTTLPSTYNGGVFFLDAQHGWIVGNETFRTSDGGATWDHLNGNGTLEDVFFLDTQHGWACGNGGIVYRSGDGGATWNGVSVSGSTMRDVFFVDMTTGWSVAIEGSVYKSTNGGASWTKQYGNTSDYFCDVQFFDANEGWAIGGASFLHTTDGGAHWQRMTVPPGTWEQGMHFSDPLHGCAVGDGSNIVVTSDGGTTWTTVHQPFGGSRLWDVKFADALNGTYVGESGTISRTTDGGLTWTNAQSGGWAQTNRLTAVDATHAWAAVQGGEVLFSHDGRFWDRAYPPEVDVYGGVSDVSFADTSIGWAVGENAFFGGSDFKIWKSADGGRTWEIQFLLLTGSFALVAAADAQTAYVVGATSTPFVIKTSDGGVNWHGATPPGSGSLDGIGFVDANTGWVVGTFFWKTTTGGDTWTKQFTPPSGGALALSVVNADVAWACGALGRVWRTVDGGATWTSRTTGDTSTLFGVHALDGNTAWVAGLLGYVAVTRDGGATWTQETFPVDPYTDLTSVWFVTAEDGWVAGNTGIWMRSVPTAVGAPPPRGEAGLLAAPNPSRAGDAVTFRSTLRTRAPLAIVDITGRVVRRVDASAFGADGTTWTWDGRDAAGRTVPRGAYVGVAQDAGRAARGRFVRR